MNTMQKYFFIAPFAPLLGAVVAGLFGSVIGRKASHVVTISGVALALIVSVFVFFDVQKGLIFDGSLYTWAVSDEVKFEVGFLVDSLTALMMLVVSFVSLMVHIYTIGYMSEDPGYQRFFSYISLFTFAMLMLVMSNNFMQLFFGWEAVGLVSYLLIGFWYTKPTAIYANLKAFLVNRVGDFGFLLGIGLIVSLTGSLNYAEVFSKAADIAGMSVPVTGWPAATAICLLLFVGAMGKSAQVPLHVWLPDSMEGPTPISALIHAATMVTAGIFMVARMSPLFELSETALSVVMLIGATTALFMGFLGIVQNDIKRVVAYSTLSQLGYMTVALGVSAYSGAIFHLMTHAFFKALLFLAAGSVIIGMHHDQDIRNMGGLRKYMPVTWLTSLVGSLALIGMPFTSGFYSKDMIIDAVKESHRWGAEYAYFCVAAGVFVTAFYSFRMYFLVFHGAERFGKVQHGDHHHAEHSHGLHAGEKPAESPWVVTLPLVLLAIPSLIVGYLTIKPLLFGDWFNQAIFISEGNDVLKEIGLHVDNALSLGLHGFLTLPFWLAVSGVGLSWLLYLRKPEIPLLFQRRFSGLYRLLENKYYFDAFNELFFAAGSRGLGKFLWKYGDELLIDTSLVNGAANTVGLVSRLSRFVQSGLIYQYAFWIIVGVVLLLAMWWPYLRIGALAS